MSINIATMGMFKDCCGGAVGGGGAPPYRQESQEHVQPKVLVKKFESKYVNTLETLLKQIKITLVED